jgi:Leucine-rich repeat (LRR) protein
MGLGRLLELQLQGTRVEDVEPLTALAQLQGLNLSRTPVRDVTALAALGNLQWIDLSGTGVSRDSVTALRRRRPDLQVL